LGGTGVVRGNGECGVAVFFEEVKEVELADRDIFFAVGTEGAAVDGVTENVFHFSDGGFCELSSAESAFGGDGGL
jgi:hypothetical protein